LRNSCTVAQQNPSQLGNIFLLAIGVVGLVACDLLPAPESRLTTSVALDSLTCRRVVGSHQVWIFVPNQWNEMNNSEIGSYPCIHEDSIANLN
jgi:hypothetical protein